MEKTVQNTDDLIKDLTDGLEPVKCLPHPLICSLRWVAFAVSYMILVIIVLGTRGDISFKVNEPVYLFELGLVTAMSLSAALSSLWLRIPDIRGQKWVVAVPISLFGVLSLWVGLHAYYGIEGVPEVHWHKCFKEAVLFGFVPALAIAFLSARGRTTHPLIMGLMNVLSVGGLGYIGLRITCASENIEHICVYHIMPYILLGLVIGIIRKRIYRW